jgi:hypothetical protein
MKKIIIPRKDHEVYFISAPVDIKRKLIRPFIHEQLQKLHPTFSDGSVFDWQHLAINDVRWFMVTVMDREILEEYRILYKKAAFYTNTAIAVHRKGFTNGGIGIIDDEQIGFDAGNNLPVSFPIERPAALASAEIASDKPGFAQAQKAALRFIPVWHGIFTASRRRQALAALGISIPAIMFLSLVFLLAARGAKDAIRLAPPAELPAENKYLPPAIEMLEEFSCDIVEAGGRMAYWKYNEDAEQFIEIQIQGIDLLKIHNICNRYEFLSLQDVHDVHYREGEPVVTIYFNQGGKGYTFAKNGVFPSQELTIQLINQLSNSLRKEKVSMSSEILPSDYNRKSSYTVTYTAKDSNLISSLDIIAAFCNEYLLNITKMDVSIAGGNSLFTVNTSLSQSVGSYHALHSLGNKKTKIPLAFGYREEARTTAPQEKKPVEAKPENPLLGSITDSYGQLVFYHDADTKKIFIKGSYD